MGITSNSEVQLETYPPRKIMKFVLAFLVALVIAVVSAEPEAKAVPGYPYGGGYYGKRSADAEPEARYPYVHAYKKRSADAEPEADAGAKPWYGYYRKRSADAEPEAGYPYRYWW